MPQIPVQTNPVGMGDPPKNPADALSREMSEARTAEFGDDVPAEVFPSKFFDYSDKVIAPDGSAQPRGPKNCATPYGAARLVQVLGPAKVLLGNPAIFDGLAGSFSDTNLVPWLQFSKNGVDGKPINAGLLLDMFNHGYPWSTALSGAQQEIEGSF